MISWFEVGGKGVHCERAHTDTDRHTYTHRAAAAATKTTRKRCKIVSKLSASSKLTTNWIEIGYRPVVPIVKIVWKSKRDFHLESAIWQYSKLVDAFE
jgi:hypothetical protein